ncbi:MAG: hypothetical protein HS119_12615 [Flavobacteriales bacterium]|nr:hypothetical protein [Flavobacteriales bacterium]MCL4856971.1 hypothetical protein [Flavobacteriales bacterium]
MANNPPSYLHVSNHLNESGEFIPEDFVNDDELIYRRFIGNKAPIHPKDDYFAEVSIDDKGISINRARYSRNPEDVLWSNEHEPEDDNVDSCNYEKKDGIVIYSSYCVINKTLPPPSFEVSILKTWTVCNVSHCDIMFTPNKSKPSKQEKRDIRFFLVSIFKGDINDVKCA